MIKKTILVTILFLIGFAIGNTVKAADVNGYTAKYECLAGGPNCNVDVVSYGNAACQQYINTTDAWSTINWAADVICLTTGDHKSKGKLTIGSSGTSGTRKVLRCTDTYDPWSGSATPCSIAGINFDGNDYWIVDRVRVDPDGNHGGFEGAIEIKSASTNNIINRVLCEDSESSSGSGCITTFSNNTTIQNSVIRSCRNASAQSSEGIGAASGSDIHIVNNEIYDCVKAVNTYQTGGTTPGLVVENNDIYISAAYQTTGGTKAYAEGLISSKDDGTSANPKQYIQNRLWGVRASDTSGCCDGGGAGGHAIFIGGGAATGDYHFVYNNIIFDTEGGVAFEIGTGSDGTDNNSIVGNIFYDMQDQGNPQDHAGVFSWAGSGSNNATEIYLNTFVDVSPNNGWINKGSATNYDVRCNNIIASVADTGSWGSGSEQDYNAYHGTSGVDDTNNINKTLNTRANSTEYSLNDIIRTTATPPADGTAGDFLYKVTTAGTSAGSPPSYTTTLGGTTTDGTMVVTAVRGPYSYYIKLRTGAAQVYVPYAKAHNSSLDYAYCPSTTGNRASIGVNNQTGTW